MNFEAKFRCFGNKAGQELLAEYHDKEWGIPIVGDDKKLFEFLILEGAQAGLSWETVLKKREGYRRAFHGFDLEKIANMKDAELEALRNNSDIIRNRLKIYATRRNAQVVIKIQRELGSFSEYLWRFVDSKTIVNRWKTFQEIPITTTQSNALSKDLKKRGMTFVGSTIMYAFMQAVGMVNDHLEQCWCSRPQSKGLELR